VPEALPTPFDIIDPLPPPFQVPISIWILTPIVLFFIFGIVALAMRKQHRRKMDQLPVPPLIVELSEIYQRFQAERSREQIHLFVKLVRREPHVLSERAQSLLSELEQLRFSTLSTKEAEFPMKEILSIVSTRQDTHDGGSV